MVDDMQKYVHKDLGVLGSLGILVVLYLEVVAVD
jgi:hypothetical protein